MAEIVNLRRARKAKARSQAAEVADGNRLRHGRSAAERRADQRETARFEARLDGHRLDEAPSRRDDE